VWQAITAAALALALFPAAPAPVAVPVLTSTPFAAAPGQAVTHTVTLTGSAAGTVAAVRVTFTTTVDLDGVRATAKPGTCPVVTARRVVCDLGDLDFNDPDTPSPTLTVTGTVHPGLSPGILVQNLVTVISGTTENVVSNAYLVPGSAVPSRATPAPAARPHGRTPIGPVILLVAFGAVVLAGGGLVAWRRRRV
jgi:hypothetical protein